VNQAQSILNVRVRLQGLNHGYHLLLQGALEGEQWQERCVRARQEVHGHRSRRCESWLPLNAIEPEGRAPGPAVSGQGSGIELGAHNENGGKPVRYPLFRYRFKQIV